MKYLEGTILVLYTFCFPCIPGLVTTAAVITTDGYIR